MLGGIGGERGSLCSNEISFFSGVKELYKLSYLWYATLAVIITVVVGLVASLITGGYTDDLTQVVVSYEFFCKFHKFHIK